MQIVNQMIVTTACVTEFCQEIETRLAVDHKLVEFLVVYQKTKGKDLSGFIDSYTAKLNLESEWFMTWCDIYLTHAHEKNGFNKIVRACEKINKTRAKEEAKRVKDQTKADAKQAKEQVTKTKAPAKAKAPVKAKALVKPSSSLSFLVIHEEEDEPTIQLPLQAPTLTQVQATVFTQMVEDQRDQHIDHLAKYNKFKVIRNAKEPACKWKRPANYI